MDDMKAKVLEVLDRAVRRDMEKGGVGCLYTTEVAQRAEISRTVARRLLDELEEDGAVECFDFSSEDSTRPIYAWRIEGYLWDEDREALVRRNPSATPG